VIAAVAVIEERRRRRISDSESADAL